MTIAKITLLLALFASGLCAGLFYAYSCSVNPGLSKLSDKGYLSAMQSINKEIQNPLFFASFFGALLLMPVAAWFQYNGTFDRKFAMLAVAALVYAIGTFGVTVICNVPLNEKLASADLASADPEMLHRLRMEFEAPWNFWHRVRTVASAFAFGLLAWACCCESK